MINEQFVILKMKKYENYLLLNQIKIVKNNKNKKKMIFYLNYKILVKIKILNEIRLM